MTENICRYSGDRNQAIVSYLYGDDSGFDRAERAAFDAHLATCDRCRTELAAFEGVRASLGRWSPPEPVGLISRQSAVGSDQSAGGSDQSAVGSDQSAGGSRQSAGGSRQSPGGSRQSPGGSRQSPGGSRQSPGGSRQSWWREIPAWAQVAAALLCLGVGAGIANLDVRYDANGLQVRTGWSAVAPVAQNSQPAAGSAGSPGSDIRWRAELTAVEQRLRADLRQPSATIATAAGAMNSEALRRVRALLDESERRQQRELALRLAEAVREVNAQRQADLVRIDRNIGAMQNNTGREMLRQRNEMLNYVSLRTASQRPQ